jgi:hypothetical protein
MPTPPLLVVDLHLGATDQAAAVRFPDSGEVRPGHAAMVGAVVGEEHAAFVEIDLADDGPVVGVQALTPDGDDDGSAAFDEPMYPVPSCAAIAQTLARSTKPNTNPPA